MLHGCETVAGKRRPASSVETLFIQQLVVTGRKVYLSKVFFFVILAIIENYWEGM